MRARVPGGREKSAKIRENVRPEFEQTESSGEGGIRSRKWEECTLQRKGMGEPKNSKRKPGKGLAAV